MDLDLLTAAAAAAQADGAFRLNAHSWTGTLILVSGDDAWVVPIEAGAAGAPQSVGSVTGGGDDDIVVEASPETWAQLLASPPPPGLVDIVGATASGLLTVTPAPAGSDRHLAVNRFGELMRHAANGTDPAPHVECRPVPVGTFDAAVGRYVHLDLHGVSHRIYFEEAGSGIGLVCQHTAGADGRQWRRLLEDERVTSRFRVVVYDLPCHGKSLPPDGVAWWAERYSLTQADAMALPIEISRILGLDRPVFIGSSIGGMLALDLARHHADEFRAVISLEGGLKVELEPEVVAASTAGLPDLHAASMMSIMSPTASEAARQETRLHYAQGAPGVFAGDIDYYAFEHDLRDEIDGFDTSRCAVHLLTGEYDHFTVPWTERAGREIPGATMQIMTGLGHFPMSEDHAGLMRYVLPILDEIAASA
jgi:pimeloyl-ACP methyl ester carboxylesterase